MDLASKLFKGDRVIWIIFMFLCLISAVEVFSATSTLAYKNVNHWAPIARHASFLLTGFVAVVVIHNIHCRFFSLGILLLLISIVMLIVTPFIGVSENDAYRWLSIFGFQVQPSEFAKLGSIIFVSFMLSKRGVFTEKTIFWWIFIGVSITCALILPENLSTAFMLFGVCFLMMFIGQISIVRLTKLAGVLILLLGLFVASWFVIPDTMWKQIPIMDRVPTWKGRLAKFFNNNNDNDANTFNAKVLFNGDNYQVTHAKIAIARGGISPQMPGHGKQRDFLPQAFSDFIYAIIIEELGLVGGGFVLLLYIMILVRAGMIARKCQKLFPKYLVLGCGLLLVVQALANMAVAVNLIPVTGQPMPLVSRGGTSTVISCVYFGIILSISRFGAHIGDEEEETEIVEETEAKEVEELLPIETANEEV